MKLRGEMKLNYTDILLNMIVSVYRDSGLRDDIQKYIKDMDYTYSARDIVQAYVMTKTGFYISYTASDCIDRFEERLYEKYEHSLKIVNGEVEPDEN